MHPGQTFEIIATENPSTGYSWQVDLSAAKGLWTLKEEFSHGPNLDGGRRLVGAPGHKKFTISAGEAVGRSIFRAANVRPWEFHGWSSFDRSSVP